MALHINLLHEQKAQEQLAQRDPLKLGILGLIVVALGFAGFYFVKLQARNEKKGEFDQVNAEFQKLEPKLKEFAAQKESLEKRVKLADLVVSKIENRFFWAPILEIVYRQMPESVQLNSFKGLAINDPHVIEIEGLAVGDQPSAVAEQVRKGLSDALREKFPDTVVKFGEGGIVDYPAKIKLGEVEKPVVKFVIKAVIPIKKTEPAK